jgi:ubiquitin-protein ligase
MGEAADGELRPMWAIQDPDQPSILEMWTDLDCTLSDALEIEYTADPSNTRCFIEGHDQVMFNFQTMVQVDKKSRRQCLLQRLLVPDDKSIVRRSIVQTSLFAKASAPVVLHYVKRNKNDSLLATAMFEAKSEEMVNIRRAWAKKEGFETRLDEWIYPVSAAQSRNQEEFSEQHVSRLMATTDRARRLVGEFSLFTRSKLLHATDARLVCDRTDRWALRVKKEQLDPDSQLYKDMTLLPVDWPGNIDHIRLDILFPPGYPRQPPYVRVVYPIFKPSTGNVSMGGSICLEALVATGQPGGYHSSISMVQLVYAVISNMMIGDGRYVAPGAVDFTAPVSEVQFKFGGVASPRVAYEFEESIENFVRVSTSIHDWGQRDPEFAKFIDDIKQMESPAAEAPAAAPASPLPQQVADPHDQALAASSSSSSSAVIGSPAMAAKTRRQTLVRNKIKNKKKATTKPTHKSK